MLEPRAAAHLAALRDSLPDGAYIIGAPADQHKIWDRSNAGEAAKEFYKEMADQTKITAISTSGEITHQWRRHLNMLLLDRVPEVIRIAQFGHSSQVNRKHYTNANDQAYIRAAGAALFERSL